MISDDHDPITTIVEILEAGEGPLEKVATKIIEALGLTANHRHHVTATGVTPQRRWVGPWYDIGEKTAHFPEGGLIPNRGGPKRCVGCGCLKSNHGYYLTGGGYSPRPCRLHDCPTFTEAS